MHVLCVYVFNNIGTTYRSGETGLLFIVRQNNEKTPCINTVRAVYARRMNRRDAVGDDDTPKRDTYIYTDSYTFTIFIYIQLTLDGFSCVGIIPHGGGGGGVVLNCSRERANKERLRGGREKERHGQLIAPKSPAKVYTVHWPPDVSRARNTSVEFYNTAVRYARNIGGNNIKVRRFEYYPAHTHWRTEFLNFTRHILFKSIRVKCFQLI